MRTKHLHFIIFLLLLGALPVRASHLVGGEITYRCLGNNDYEITMIIYRDCISSQNAPFDANAAITIFNQSGNIVANLSVPLQNVTQLPVVAPNNCTTLPPNVCTEKGLYIDTVNLPPIPGGYVITHQRCCRNSTITNVPNPALWGSTYTTSIPSMDNCNRNPKFSNDPPVVLCVNQFIKMDLGATDADGDSLHYELCTVLHGGAANQGNAAPDPAAPPPYSGVPLATGFTTSVPITSSPAFSIDPATGELKGKPTQVGQFVFAICVSEWRNGVKLSTTRRDFQFNVSASCKIIASEIQSQFLTSANICSGGPVRFTNLSKNASTYWWDFGDTTSTIDTSRLTNPSYVYPDTGRYWVTLVAEPHTGCADTSISLFYVYDSTKVKFTFDGDICLDGSGVNFSTSGVYGDSATFSWDFGGTTNLGLQTDIKQPAGVRWTSPGTYIVTVEVSDFGCSNTFSDVVEVVANPVIDEEVPASVGCLPHTVNFKDRTQASGVVQHFWFFGDGEVSFDPNPEHVYTKPGVFTVEHAIKTIRGCIDSGYSRYQNVIEVLPVPHSALKVSSHEEPIYNPNFNITNASSGQNYTETILPDGRLVKNMTSERITLEDTGNHEVVHISFNEFGCTDTLVDTLRVTTPFNLYMPNAFTPNGDGVNDLFIFHITDARSVHFEVYNRWGEMVFNTNNPNGGWNGRLHNSGEKLPGGVYAYVLIADIKKGAYEHVQQGSINLVR